MSYSLATFGAAWFGQSFEDVATRTATCLAIQSILRREQVCKHCGESRGGKDHNEAKEGKQSFGRPYSPPNEHVPCNRYDHSADCNDDPGDDYAQPRTFNFHWLLARSPIAEQRRKVLFTTETGSLLLNPSRCHHVFEVLEILVVVDLFSGEESELANPLLHADSIHEESHG